MSKNVNFYLGPAVGLSKRVLTITRIPGAGDDDPLPLAAQYGPTDQGGSATTASISLPDNKMWQATLVDTLTGDPTGKDSDADVLNFCTAGKMFPGPRSGDRLNIVSMEDNSSSSSSSSSASSKSSWSRSSNSSSSSSSSKSSYSRSSNSSSSSSSSKSSHSHSSLSSKSSHT